MRFLDHQNIIKLFHQRHACKKFDPSKTISKEDFDTILESARLAPSAFGLEPWNIIVLRDKNIKASIYPHAWGGQNALDCASEFLIILARKNIDLNPDSAYVEYMMKDIQQTPKENLAFRKEIFSKFQKDNFNMYNDEKAIFSWACRQCYIVLSHIMTTATMLGIDSLAIEGFDQKNINEILANHNCFDKKHFEVAVMVALGHRTTDPKRAKTRQSIDKIVRFV